MIKYPSKCAMCGHVQVYPAVITDKFRRRGIERVVLDVPVTQCRHCHEVYLSDNSEKQIEKAFKT